MPAFDLSRASAEALEFPSLLALVAHKAATDLGHQAIAGLRPFDDEASLAEHRRAYQEAERLIAARPLVPGFERPLEPLLEQLGRGGYDLTGRDLVVLGDFLRACDEALLRIREAEPACEALTERCEELDPLTELTHKLDRTFDRRGEIREDASPRLLELRSRIRSARNNLYSELRSHVETEREHLSEETIPLRGGRLVLVLRAGSRGKVEGLTHGRSSSGRSFYYEPFSAVELNNDLQQSVEEEEAEKRRILAEVVDLLRAQLPSIRSHAEIAAGLDRLQAGVRFAQAADAHLAELGSSPPWVLSGARHPLLDPALAPLRREALGQPGHENAIVPLELELGGDHRAVVVTGPNAGGKTVALKTLGLLALAHQCGLPLPAEKGTRLPLFSGLVATVGDDQDLLADRSTFSGRLLRLKEAWEAAGPHALILLDELGSGTDPEEGAALSIALLETLLASHSLVFITTHLTQLAAAALDMEAAVCAAMEFDAETGQPTYRLLPGPPGGSEALALARRLGLPAPWIDRADELLGSEHRDLRRLLAEVEQTRRQLATRQSRLEAELRDVEILRRRLAEEEAALAAETKRVGKALRQELREFKDATRAKLREEVDRLRRELEAGRKKGLVARAVETLFEEAPVPEVDTEPEETEVAVGGRVRHRHLGWEGTLEKLERGRAQVRVSGKVFRCREDEIRGVGAAAAPEEPSRRWKVERRAGNGRDITEEAPRELNLIGRRVEPALEELDRFLDQSLLASHGKVRVIHGHGSGQLRRAVREHLRGHPAVARQQPGRREEGGDGATLVELRS